jgi:dihydroorotase
MPNLRPPITTVEAARRYRKRIEDALSEGLVFAPLMTAYLTDDLDPNELERGFVEGVFAAAKLYPANATTNSADGVSDLVLIAPLLERMEAIDMPLLIHGEVTDPDVDVFDREAVFIERHLIPLRERHPGLRIVLEHITTEQAVDYVGNGDQRLAATITPHHLHLNRNAMFLGGLKSDFYCLPVVKRECHRRALVKAATSGLPCFFLGTDSAPHLRSGKESACGCAEEEARQAARRRLNQSTPMTFSLDNRKAIKIAFQATQKHRIAIEMEVMGRDCGSQTLVSIGHVIHGLLCGDVL